MLKEVPCPSARSVRPCQLPFCSARTSLRCCGYVRNQHLAVQADPNYSLELSPRTDTSVHPAYQKRGLWIWQELGSGLLPVHGAHSYGDTIQIPINELLQSSCCILGPDALSAKKRHPYSFGTSSWVCAVEGSAGSHLNTPHDYTHPHNIDSDQHIDGVVAGDPLEHAEVGVVSCLLGDIVRERHFVDTHRALVRGSAQPCETPAAQGLRISRPIPNHPS